ncbi:MAG: hypothetical protein IT287_07935 [Bdellovibrionaceae bacterium]|nr:hypothetical protein [Pseudobdellovibrionaceae bacterium]
MTPFAHFFATALILFASSAHAQTLEPSDTRCFESAEEEYAHHTEILMHTYERAQVSPRDFEKLRSDLIVKRDNQVSSCSYRMMIGAEEPEDQTLVTEVSEQRSVASIRAPASFSIIKPMPQNPIAPTQAQDEPLRRGVYTEVLSEDSGHECGDDPVNESTYNGERVSVGN